MQTTPRCAITNYTQRAREFAGLDDLLSASEEEIWEFAARTGYSRFPSPEQMRGWARTIASSRAALRAIEAALRLPAGEGFVLVPREPTPEMLALALSHLYGSPFWRPDARPIGTFYSGHTADESEKANIAECGPDRLKAAYAAMLAAAPRHETGESA